MSDSGVRIDKWLWAVRLFKTRALAAEACRGGKVKVGDAPAKAARDVRIGDLLDVQTVEFRRRVRVVGLTDKRLGAPLVPQFMEDLTPPEELKRRSDPDFRPLSLRPKGSGRPTKKERRQIDEFTGAD
jgi:ribosome-associated heat shock protein Hsp15